MSDKAEQKHTPLPWAIERDSRPDMHWNNHIVSEKDPNRTICFMTHDGTEENIIGEANAQLVFKACNNHYKLVEALKAITDCYGVGYKDPAAFVRDVHQFMMEARQALAEVK